MKANVMRIDPAARVALAVIGVITFGIGLALAQNENIAARKNKASTYIPLIAVPEKSHGRKNPFDSDTQAIAAGGKLFEQHCAVCHGKKAGGTRKGPGLLREEVQQATPGTIFWILTNGVVRRGMPVWSKLPEPERWQIVAFLQSLKSPAKNPPFEKVEEEDRRNKMP